MDNLKELRKSRGFLQKDIAAMLGIERTTYVRYENGDSEPSFDTLILLADYFNVSVDYLLGREKQPPQNDISSISPDDEQKLIKKYRSLTEEGRKNVFATILKQLRRENKVTQEKLAKALNLETSSISKYESANVIPPAEIFCKMADYFNVSVDYLLGREEQLRQSEASSISPAEQQLIKKYRSLTEERQETVLDFVNTLVATESPPKSNIPAHVKNLDDLQDYIKEQESQKTVVAAYGGNNTTLTIDKEKQDKLDELMERIKKLEERIGK